MKKLVMICAMAACITLSSKAQSLNITDIPVNIKTSFSDQFGAATDISWSGNSRGYSATFLLEGNRYFVDYSVDGKVTSQRAIIKEGDLPELVTAAIKRDYPSHKFDEIEKAQADTKVSYKVKLKGSPNVDVEYDAAGNMTKK